MAPGAGGWRAQHSFHMGRGRHHVAAVPGRVGASHLLAVAAPDVPPLDREPSTAGGATLALARGAVLRDHAGNARRSVPGITHVSVPANAPDIGLKILQVGEGVAERSLRGPEDRTELCNQALAALRRVGSLRPPLLVAHRPDLIDEPSMCLLGLGTNFLPRPLALSLLVPRVQPVHPAS